MKIYSSTGCKTQKLLITPVGYFIKLPKGQLLILN